jgi:hypothetical protein
VARLGAGRGSVRVLRGWWPAIAAARRLARGSCRVRIGCRRPVRRRAGGVRCAVSSGAGEVWVVEFGCVSVSAQDHWVVLLGEPFGERCCLLRFFFFQVTPGGAW